MNIVNKNVPTGYRIIGLFALVFGLLTLREGGAVLFGDSAARVAAGDYVPFVVTFNFVAGFFYVLGGASIVAGVKWSTPVAVVIAASTLITFAAFGFHIFNGNPYEVRTVAAMTLRSLVWVGIAITLRRSKYYGCPLHTHSCAT